ncbi:MAG: hypothetical protein MUC83_05115 [Pirellula sp.]|nr:hypothetical protein [Pirellula sp.]
MQPNTSVETGGENYPCKGNLCGCQTAQQCWTSCCCTTPEERLAWAIKNNVTPPVYAVLSSRQSSNPSDLLSNSNSANNHSNRDLDASDKSSCPHCSDTSQRIKLIESDTYCGGERSKSHECSKPQPSSKNGSDKSKLATCESSSSIKNDPISRTQPPKIRFVRVIDTLKCHGLTFTLDLISQCVIPELHAVTISVEREESLIDKIRTPYPVYLAVSIPPPRV